MCKLEIALNHSFYQHSCVQYVRPDGHCVHILSTASTDPAYHDGARDGNFKKGFEIMIFSMWHFSLDFASTTTPVGEEEMRRQLR
jgi:hypothetical protein